uniref:SRP9-21 domain-containing protein n=1 Tax=Heterorhabditis bacteriophora TaxID=37862 RepID=A0A1I7X0V7_HETBA
MRVNVGKNNGEENSCLVYTDRRGQYDHMNNEKRLRLQDDKVNRLMDILQKMERSDSRTPIMMRSRASMKLIPVKSKTNSKNKSRVPRKTMKYSLLLHFGLDHRSMMSTISRETKYSGSDFLRKYALDRNGKAVLITSLGNKEVFARRYTSHTEMEDEDDITYLRGSPPSPEKKSPAILQKKKKAFSKKKNYKRKQQA